MMEKLLWRLLFILSPIALLAGPAQAMTLSFSWGPTKACFDSKSPPIRLKGVPRKTVAIRFRMKDLDAPNYPHGGGTVKYRGRNYFPYGSFRYRGPCPPRPHRYRITAEALDRNGRVLARAHAVRRFP
jgi:hypothetical protein